MMGSIKCIGECLPAFLLAVLFDCFGLILLFIGLFANLRLNNSFYGDFLIYSGSLFIFLSLAFWVMWYAGNIPVSEDYGLKKKRSGIVGQLARKLSERLSQKPKVGQRAKCVTDEDDYQVGIPPHKPSRVTWGKSTAYRNEGYDDSLDSPTVEKNAEEEGKEIWSTANAS